MDRVIQDALRVARQKHDRGGKSAPKYADPPSKTIDDWKWRPLDDVKSELGLKEIPSHVLAFGRFMDETARKAASKGLSARDLIKAFTITRSSIQRRATDANRLRAAGLILPDEVTGPVRPEGAFGQWLHSTMGRRYLNGAEKGKVDMEAVRNAVQVMAPFGRHETDIPDALIWAATNLPGQEKKFSDMVAAAAQMESPASEWRAQAKQLRGIGPAKAGFVASMMGRGDQPTLDARQLIVQTGRPTSEATPFLRRKSGMGAEEGVERLAARQKAMDLTTPSDLEPYYQHLAHHAIWDKASNEETTHQDVMDAMRHAADGGRIEDAKDITHHPVAQAFAAFGAPGIPNHFAEELDAFGTVPEFKRGGPAFDEAELQKRMKQILRPDEEDPERAAKYLQARASYMTPTDERGAYSKRVLPIPAHDVTTQIGNIPGVSIKNPEPMSWNKFHQIAKGGTLFTLGGDRSNLGRLTHINGKELAWPVDLHAGVKYMAEPNPGAVWANAKTAATTLQNNIKKAAKKGPVFGAFAPMGPTSVDSSVNMFDVLMAQVPGSDLSPEAVKKFDDDMRSGAHVLGKDMKSLQKRMRAQEIMREWPGIKNAKEAAEFGKKLSGEHRGMIVKHMEKAPFQNAGFPSVGITRAAITDPELLDAPGNMMGHRVVELHPDQYDTDKLLFEHSTYPVPTKGELVGRLPLIERHIAMPDFTEEQIMHPSVMKTGEPTIIHPYSINDQGRSSFRGNTEMRQGIQPINEKMLESIQAAHGSDFAKGGIARNPSQMMRLHPAMSIPGVHIRTAEAGDPIFRGGK